MVLEVGDIIVVHSNTLIGRIIRWVTQSWASHVAVYIGEGFVFEARPGGARTVPLANYVGGTWTFRSYRLNVDKAAKDKFIYQLIQKTGVGYDYGQILSIAIHRLFDLELKAQNRRLAICSEIVYQSAKEAGIPVPPIPQAYITPNDFLNWDIATPVDL